MAEVSKTKSFPIVGIGASAGGLETFTELLKHLPGDTGMAFVLVQHLDPKHASLLAELLHKATKMPVAEIKDGMKAEPDHVYVIPPNADIAVFHGVLHLMPRGETGGLHLPIDYFFRSLSLDQGAMAIGVVLSGTASDGAQGLKAIKAEGGIAFTQDPESAKYDGMPRAAIAAGGVDFILSPQRMAKELARIGRHPYLAPKKNVSVAELLPATRGDLLDKIFIILRGRTGVDFAYYKQATIKRRIARRMALLRLESLGEYTHYLEDNLSESDALYEDILITVTNFFREPEVFEALKTKVFPAAVENKGAEAPVRIWVPGCSTGEEAYSIAISLLEFLQDRLVKPPIQIFATDLSEPAITTARSGVYPVSISENVTPERLKRFFTQVESGYQVNKSIREMCVFARHNVTRDPPFSRLDLISCRNLLIYLGPVLQKRVIPMFHYALNPEGWLLLGTSESVGAFDDLFSPLDKKRKIFAKKPKVAALPIAFAGHGSTPQAPHLEPKTSGLPAEAPGEFDIQKEADRLVLTRYAPAGVIVNDDMEILQFRGQTGPYLEAAPGKASLNILKMARVGLPVELRAAIAQAKKTGAAVAKEAVRLTYDDHLREINIVVSPIKAPAGARYFLVLFKDVTGTPVEPEAEPSGSKAGRAKQTPAGRRLVQLERELAVSRDHLQTIIQERDANNEELRAANEEVQSSNEELQSINEELETSKEELQSTNEELTTVNDELQNRNFELARLNDDLTNLSISVNIATIMVDRSLRVRRFTSMAEEALGLIPGDIGRPIGDINLNVDVGVLARLVSNVVDNLAIAELEMKDKNGRWFSMRVRPYKTADNKIEGAVITFVDIDPLKRNQERIEEARDYAEAIVDTVREPLLVLDAQLHVISANPAFYRTFKALPGETENKLVYELGNGQWNMPELRTLLEDILPLSSDFADFEVVRDFPRIGRRTMVLSARRIVSQHESGRMILLAVDDITERRLAEEQYKRAVAASLDGFWITDDLGRILEVNDAYCRLIGYSRDELSAMRIQDVEAVESSEETAGRIARIKRTGSDHYETRHRRKDGGLVDFEITATYSAATDQFYVFIHDMTERNKSKAFGDALNEINMALSSTLDFDSIIPTVMSKALAAIGCETSSAMALEDGRWILRYVSGLPSKLVGTTFTDDQQRHFALVHRTKAPLVVDDAYSDQRVDRSSMEEAGLRSFLLVPLIAKKEVVGALAFHYRSAPVGFNSLQIDFAVKLAASVSLAIENMRLYNSEREARRFGEDLSKISKHLASTVDFDKTMKQLATDGAKAMSADQCRIFMLENGRWVLRFVFGLPAKVRGETFELPELPAANLAYDTGRPVAVDETAGDERVNPKVMRKYGVRAMLAAPLAGHDRQLGVIFFDYRKPRRFSAAHIDFAAKLGSAISLAMENSRLYHAEHVIAETLQEAMLTMPESLPGVAFGHLYESATEATRVGGDFYDLFELEHGRIGIVIGDVAGKGLEAAALTALVKSSIKAYAFEGMFPAGVMAKTNNVITRTTSEAVLVTGLFAILDKAGGQLTYCCAGHLPAMVQKLDGTVVELEPGAPVIGIFADATFDDKSVILKPGERLILYTDGIIEARREGKFFGEAGLMRSIKKHTKEPIEKLPMAIFKEVSKYTGGALSDDVAVLAVSLADEP